MPDASKASFFDLPEDIRYLVCVQAQALTNELDQLVANRKIRASTIYRIGCEIANLSSICCLVREMLDGGREWSVPRIEAIQDHSRALDLEKDGCPCCSAERLLSLERDVLRRFPDEGEEAPVAKSIQESALNVLVREAEKVLRTLDDLIVGEQEVDSSILTRVSGSHKNYRTVFSKARELLKRMKTLRLVEWRKRLAKQRVTFEMVTWRVTVIA